MVTWDDLAVILNKASDEFEKAIKAFESLSKTYDELIKYCKERRGENENLMQARVTQVGGMETPPALRVEDD